MTINANLVVFTFILVRNNENECCSYLLCKSKKLELAECLRKEYWRNNYETF